MKIKVASSLLFFAGLTLIAACAPQGTGLQKDDANQVEPDRDEDGVTTTKYDANTTQSQTFQASGSSDIQSATITILPGSLGIDTEVTIEEAESITDPNAGTSLGLEDTTFTAGGPAVAITSSLLIDTTQPFTVSLPIAVAAGLSLTELDNIVIVYKVTKAADGGGLSLGVFPTSAIRLEGGMAKVESTWFGVYQVAYANKPIIERVETRTTAPIIVKSKSTTLTGNWKSICSANVDDEEKPTQPSATETATQSNDNDQDPEWEIQQFSFSHDRLNFSMKNFRDENCQKAILKMEIGGSYRLGDSASAASDAKNIDVKIDSFVLTLLNPANTADANENKLCGFSDWVTNKARSVTDPKACKFGDDGKQGQPSGQRCPDGPPEPGKNYYTIVRVEGNTLKTGNESYPNCGLTPETRNAELSDKAGDILTKY